jgi:hypothetical protein
MAAAIAQLGERKTEDLKVTGSIPVRGIIYFSSCFFLRIFFLNLFPPVDLFETVQSKVF